MAKPFCKFVGGKTQNLPKLIRAVPKHVQAYYEPMVGGGALFWHLASSGQLDDAKKIVLADVNKPLIRTYIGVRDNVQAVIDELTELVAAYYVKDPEKLYYGVRDRWNSGVHSPARYIFLKQTSYNGLWRTNKKGNINMPWGHYEKPNVLDRENLENCSKILENVDLRYGHWEDTIDGLTDHEDSVVYFDPPYLQTFDKYNADGFSLAEHRKLLESCALLTRHGVHVIYSNEANKTAKKFLNEHWPDAITREIPTRRFINCDGTGRKPVDDLLVYSDMQRELFA